MKELTIEEKAKRYDKALERSKAVKGTYLNLGNISAAIVLESIFPELKESDDKRISKALIHLISEQDGFLTAINGISVEDILAWLEKQGEQKPAWSEEDEMMLECAIDKISDFGTGAMIKDWLKSIKDRVQPQPKQEWSEEDSTRLYWVIQWLSHVKMYNNAPLDTKHIDEDITWLKSLKERMKGE